MIAAISLIIKIALIVFLVYYRKDIIRLIKLAKRTAPGKRRPSPMPRSKSRKPMNATQKKAVRGLRSGIKKMRK